MGQLALLRCIMLLILGAKLVAGALQGADMDPMRDATYNSLKAVSRKRNKQVQPRVTGPATASVDSSSSTTPTTTSSPPAGVSVKVAATTLKGLRCKPLECSYDTKQSAKAQLRGEKTWSLAPTRAGVFAKGDVEHYLHIVKLCHTMKGAFDATSVAAVYNPETGKIHMQLQFSDVSAQAQAVTQFDGMGTAVNSRVSALLADSLIMHEAPVVVDEVTVQGSQQASV